MQNKSVGLVLDRNFKQRYCSLTAPHFKKHSYPFLPGCHKPLIIVICLCHRGILKVFLCVFLGLSDLIHDNLTESKRTINLLQRMNIYQEVFLSVLYRLLPIQVTHHSAVSSSQQACKTHRIRVMTATAPTVSDRLIVSVFLLSFCLMP